MRPGIVRVVNLHEWLTEITDGASAGEIADHAHLPRRTVQHQISTGRMSLENLVAIAVAYSHHPLRTLIEWDVVNPEWERIPDIEAALRLATEDQLADEVLRRMKLGVESDALTTPVDKIAHLDDRRPVTPTVTDEDEDAFAASDAPVEPEEGDDDFGPGA